MNYYCTGFFSATDAVPKKSSVKNRLLLRRLTLGQPADR